ncbi:MAG: phosphoribosylformylglycinamidine synthase I [candidate division WOR-3 bacterium]|nr:phosphoribosylformylglycinamidine synthase I [candidate division WOR-3 bacterium]
MNKFKALVLKAHGVNCEIESAHALKRCGFLPDIIHIDNILKGNASLSGYSFMVFPGGFSYGDYTGSGRIVASIIKHHLMDDIKAFIEEGKLILGICNGFQILVKSGILPNRNNDFSQNASLIFNDSHHYEDRWVHLKVRAGSAFTSGISTVMELPIAHAEGKFVFAEDDFPDIDDYTVMEYCDSTGNTVNHYPVNPNGSMKNIAAIRDKTGRIMGMMPHPERFYADHLYYGIHSPSLTGSIIFDNAYKYIKEEL